MYQGTRQRLQRLYTDRYRPGLGTLTVPIGVADITEHVYVCDHCGRTYAFPELATEPFYCHSEQCQASRLVSIQHA